MDPISALIGVAVLSAGAYAWKRWGKPFAKKRLDNPNTPQDESAFLDPIADAAIKLAAELFRQEAEKKGLKEDPKTIAYNLWLQAPEADYKVILAKVNKALGRK